MLDIKIDLVYLWVDGNDKEWQEKRNYWAEKLGLKEEISLDRCRYVDNQELKYSLRSAEMYAPWINKIFIITDNQVPKWLDTNHPKIRIVNHADIIPNEYLPTFNSEAIETCIANIPDLSEYFLYANDDMFFATTINQDYFFDKEGKPYIDIKQQSWSEDEINKSLYKFSYNYTVKLLKKRLSSIRNYEEFCSCHCIDAYRKSLFLECKNTFNKEFTETLERKFRLQNSIQRSIIGYYMVEKQKANIRNNSIKQENELYSQVNNLYLSLNDYEIMYKYIIEKKPKLLCINDTNSTVEDNRIKLKLLLEKLFPNKSIWEKRWEDDISSISHVVEKNSPINFSFNNGSVNYFIKNQKRILKNKKNNILNIINENISQKNKDLLLKTISSNIDIRFIDMNKLTSKTPYFEEMKLIEYLTNLKSTEKIVFWGASLFLESFIDKYQINLKNIIGIIDINEKRKGQKLGKYQIYPPEIIKSLNVKKIIVTIINSSAIRIAEIRTYLDNNDIGGIKIEKL